MATAKVDLYKAFAADYATPRQPALVVPRAAQYLAIEGRGAPGGTEFVERLGCLYNVAFTIKMARKLEYSEPTIDFKLKATEEFKKRLGILGSGLSMLPADKENPQFRVARLTGFLGRPNFSMAAAGHGR